MEQYRLVHEGRVVLRQQWPLRRRRFPVEIIGPVVPPESVWIAAAQRRRRQPFSAELRRRRLLWAVQLFPVAAPVVDLSWLYRAGERRKQPVVLELRRKRDRWPVQLFPAAAPAVDLSWLFRATEGRKQFIPWWRRKPDTRIPPQLYVPAVVPPLMAWQPYAVHKRLWWPPERHAWDRRRSTRRKKFYEPLWITAPPFDYIWGVQIGSGATVDIKGQCPEDVTAFTKAALLCHADATETVQYDLYCNSGVDGSNTTDNPRSSTNNTQAVTSGKLYELDVSTEMGSITAGQFFRLRIESDIDHMYIIGLILEWD